LTKYLENDYTVTAYTELYCGDNRVLRNLIQAMLGVGACIGVLFINFFADYKGRKISFLLSVFAGILSIIGILWYILVLIIGSYTKNVNLFIISNTLSGFCGNSVITTIYIMSDRLMSQKYSKFCILVSNAFL
jgi:MFS family permease